MNINNQTANPSLTPRYPITQRITHSVDHAPPTHGRKEVYFDTNGQSTSSGHSTAAPRLLIKQVRLADVCLFVSLFVSFLCIPRFMFLNDLLTYRRNE
jgi:hypothetical protein